MGEMMLGDALAMGDDPRLQNITGHACGLGAWHVVDGADARAVKQLADQGYDGTEHIAATFGPEHEAADIFLAMDKGLVTGLKRQGVDPQKIHLYRAFDPASVTVDRPHPEVADPYYGTEADFASAAEEIEA